MTPRILFVAPWLPYPLDSGVKQRMFHLLKALSSLGPVNLVCYREPRSQPDHQEIGPLRDLCDTVDILPWAPSRWEAPIGSWADVLRRFVVSPTPYLITDFPGVPLARRVAALTGRADLIWVERIFVSEWLTAGRDRTIVDLDDLESVKESRRLALQPARPYQLAQRLDALKLRRLERRAPARYARVVVCSEGDRGFFPGRHRHKALVVPNGIPARLLSVPGQPRDPATLVMVGTMGYAPNVDAATWFLREILPRVVRTVPDVRLYLVGDDPRGALRDVHDGQRIVVTGRVDDVTPYVSRAAVSLAPLRVGGGTRIKILEALALGTPVVSTTLGAEGLEAVAGRHLCIADTPAAFASDVSRLLRDPSAREPLARAGRALVAERYTWDAIGARLEADIRGFLRERIGQRAAEWVRLSAG